MPAPQEPHPEQKQTDRTVAPPSISLPKGGGAIRGMGEKFAANPVTGTGSMTIPIAASPGRAGFSPQLSLSYDSGAGNGPFGFGWNLSLPSITRKTDKGLPKYQDQDDSDVFILSGAEDLVPEFEKDAAGNWIFENGRHKFADKPRTVGETTYTIRRYRPRTEGLFARIERWTSQKDPADVRWNSFSRDNIITILGRGMGARGNYLLFCIKAQANQPLDSYHQPGNVHDCSCAAKFLLDCFEIAKQELKGTIFESQMGSTFSNMNIIEILPSKKAKF